MIFNRVTPLKLLARYVHHCKVITAESSGCQEGLLSGLNALSITNNSKPNTLNSSQKKIFSPRSIGDTVGQLYWKKPSILDIPLLPVVSKIPLNNQIAILDLPLVNDALECPTNADVPEKQAARLIVIRRRKMRVHKLKKLKKRMRFEWKKLRLRRKSKKEKAFQAMLVAKVQDAQKWSAEQYVTEKLNAANEEPIPRYWKGKRLPRFLIRQLMGLDPKKNYRPHRDY